MILAYENKVFDYVISATNEQPNQPVENLQDERLSRKWQSVTGGTLYLTLDTSFTADCVIVKDHNIALTDTVTLEGSSTIAFSSIDVSESLTVVAGGFGKTFTSATKYWRLKIVAANPVFLGGLYIGESWEMPAYELSSITEYTTKDTAYTSESGQKYGDKKYNYRISSFVFPWVYRDVDDVVLRDLWDTHTIVKPFYVIQYEDKQSEYPIWYCVMTDSLKLQEDSTNVQIFINTAFKIEEAF